MYNELKNYIIFIQSSTESILTGDTDTHLDTFLRADTVNKTESVIGDSWNISLFAMLTGPPPTLPLSSIRKR